MDRSLVISEILRDIGQVCLASVVIAPIMNGVISIPILLMGILFSFMLWLISIVIIK